MKFSCVQRRRKKKRIFGCIWYIFYYNFLHFHWKLTLNTLYRTIFIKLKKDKKVMLDGHFVQNFILLETCSETISFRSYVFFDYSYDFQ